MQAASPQKLLWLFPNSGSPPLFVIICWSLRPRRAHLNVKYWEVRITIKFLMTHLRFLRTTFTWLSEGGIGMLYCVVCPQHYFWLCTESTWVNVLNYFLSDVKVLTHVLWHQVNGDIPPRLKKSAHDVILDFIRSRPPLNPVSPTPPPSDP